MAVKTVQVIINGATTTLSYNSQTGKYEATITAPSKSSYNVNDGHYYPVTVKATDEAGNVTTKTDTDSTLGASLKLKVKEKAAPVITITSPTAGSYITNNKPTIKWKVTDADSGVNPATIGITIDGGSNAAAQKSVTCTVDTVPPTLSISVPTDKLVTNKTAVTVKGTTNDATSSPVTVTVKLNSGTATAVTVGTDGSFSKDLTLSVGSNTITITAKDAAGKTTTVTRTVTVDQTAPVIKSVTITPNPVDAGKTYVISVEVTD